MQEYRKDGTKGEPKEFDSLDDLFPELKKSLQNEKVKYVKVWMLPGRKHRKCFKIQEEQRSPVEALKKLFEEEGK